MTVAITVDPEIPVPPVHYGGIERIVDLLVRGLLNHGYKVALFANRDSSVPCHLEPYPSVRSGGDLRFARGPVSSAESQRVCNTFHP
jgi:hypothetical protein